MINYDRITQILISDIPVNQRVFILIDYLYNK